MAENKDAELIKTLAELGLLKQRDTMSSSVADVMKQLDHYEEELGELDPTTLTQYLTKSP